MLGMPVAAAEEGMNVGREKSEVDMALGGTLE